MVLLRTASKSSADAAWASSSSASAAAAAGQSSRFPPGAHVKHRASRARTDMQLSTRPTASKSSADAAWASSSSAAAAAWASSSSAAAAKPTQDSSSGGGHVYSGGEFFRCIARANPGRSERRIRRVFWGPISHGENDRRLTTRTGRPFDHLGIATFFYQNGVAGVRTFFFFHLGSTVVLQTRFGLEKRLTTFLR